MELFDFDHDGHTSFGENVLGFGLLGMVCDHISASEEVSEQIEELELQKEEAEDALSCLEDSEPEDMTSPAYARWEERRDALELLISDLDDALTELEELLED